MKCLCGRKMKRTKRSAHLRCTGKDRTAIHGIPAEHRAAYYANVKARLARMYPTTPPLVGRGAEETTTDEVPPAWAAE